MPQEVFWIPLGNESPQGQLQDSTPSLLSSCTERGAEEIRARSEIYITPLTLVSHVHTTIPLQIQTVMQCLAFKTDDLSSILGRGSNLSN